MTVKIDKETLFGEIVKMNDNGIDEAASKKMVADIINVFREQRLTYDQAYEMLGIVKTTLSVMSNSTLL